jgi:hypothetical protein
MARPVRPGTGTTHRMSEASQPGKQNGTLFADPIKASSPNSTASTGRTEGCSRPTPIRQISLAMREPSTEDTHGLLNDRSGAQSYWVWDGPSMTGVHLFKSFMAASTDGGFTSRAATGGLWFSSIPSHQLQSGHILTRSSSEPKFAQIRNCAMILTDRANRANGA